MSPDGPTERPAIKLSPESASPDVAAPLFDPAPLVATTRNWTRWAGPAFSVMFLAVVLYQLRTMDFRALFHLIPSSPVFWIAFALYYLAGPLSEQVIFGRLWKLPGHAFPELLRKQVSNELLVSYLGELYFYAWAKRHARITTAPFGAIKDVAILSAMMGNVFTLLMLVLSAPLIGQLNLPISTHTFIGSALFITGTSFAVTFFRKRLFSLPRRELVYVAVLHVVRIVAMMLLAAVMWHRIVPSVELWWWLLLATLNQLTSRLPFVPNKDVVFAGLAAFLVGPENQIAEAVTLLASLKLGAHLAVGGVLGLTGLINDRRDD